MNHDEFRQKRKSFLKNQVTISKLKSSVARLFDRYLKRYNEQTQIYMKDNQIFLNTNGPKPIINKIVSDQEDMVDLVINETIRSIEHQAEFVRKLDELIEKRHEV